ncbi:hypothetical protein JCM10212_006165 [Sporobolomyces blumeae]
MSASNPPTSSWKVPLSLVALALALTGSTRLVKYLVLAPIVVLVGTIAILGGTVWVARVIDLKEQARARLGRDSSGGPGTSDNPSRRATIRRVPPLHFTSPAAWSMTQTKAAWESAPSGARRSPARETFPTAPPFLLDALDDLLSLITRDFVLKWYASMSDSPAFPNAVEQTILDSIARLSTRVSTVDWSDVLVGRILPLLTQHLDTFRSAEHALRRQDVRTDLTESDELDLFLASRFAAELASGRLHEAVDVASPNSRPAEEAWLRSLFGRILPLVLPEREVDSQAVAIMVREIVASAVMLPIFDMLGDPDFWNRIIDDKAGSAIRDQNMVDQFRQALDQQGPLPNNMARSASISTSKEKVGDSTPRTENISVRTGQKQFDSWLKGISKTKNVADAKRLRSDVSTQIRKAKALVDGKAPEDTVEGVKVAAWLVFIERLVSAKRAIEQRIAELGGQTGEARRPYAATLDGSCPVAVRLVDILSNPTSLSYFLEFQERRKASQRVQFWLLVQGLKDPLEGLVDPSPGLPISSSSGLVDDDLKLIWDTYLARDPFRSSPAHLETIRSYLDRSPVVVPTSADVQRVRSAVFAIQHEVLAKMEEVDFVEFARSDLYFKAIAHLASSPAPPQVSSPTTLHFDLLDAVETPQSPTALAHPPLFSRPSAPLIVPHRSPSPASPMSLPGKGLTLQRTETAPPQVTFEDPFDPPKMRRVGSDGGGASTRLAPTSRKASSGSLDTQRSTSSTLARTKGPALSDSLEFLMASPDPGVTDERLPLFGTSDEGTEGQGQGDEAGSGELVDRSPASEDDYVQVQTIEAIQDALNSILETNARPVTAAMPSVRSPSPLPGISSDERGRSQPTRRDQPLLPPPRHHSLSTVTSSPTSSAILPPPKRTVSNGSAPLPSTRSRTVFDDAASIDDVDAGADDDVEPDFNPQSIRFAAPGDLHLPGEIVRLSKSLEKLRGQESVVGALIRKAELTGNSSELKILIKSRESLRREIRAATFQKDQYELQESENQLTPTGTRVTIPGTTVGQAEGQQQFQLYLVEVHQVNADGSFRSGWIVTRRYSEFAALYAKLKDKFVPARYLEFPGKRIVTSYSKEFIEQRRIGLERYLQALIKIPIICRSQELRAFLSQHTISLPKSDPSRRVPAGLSSNQNFIRTFYRSVTSGIDDVLGTSTTSMMDTIIERLSQQAAEFAGTGGIREEDLVDKSTPSTTGGMGQFKVGEEGLTYFTAPICDLFVTIFELREKNNWLRRQAILIVLQQVLGGTIERKFRDSVKMLLAPPQLTTYIASLKAALWPDGHLRPKAPPRTTEDKRLTKESANRKLSALMPDVAANLIGRHNARQGAKTLFAIVQNKRLLKHLIFSIVDEVISILFPELRSVPPPSAHSRATLASSGSAVGAHPSTSRSSGSSLALTLQRPLFVT